jgi:Rhs element Vgr protein
MSTPRTTPSSQRPSYRILINGEELPRELNVLTIQVLNELNRVASAKLTLADGEAATETFEQSSGEYFVPGNEVEIELGYSEENQAVFKGIIVKQRIAGKTAGSTLEVFCKHGAFRMTQSEKYTVFEEITDADVIEQIAGNYGIAVSTESTSVQHQNLVQYKSTDWDFIVNRAEANGQAVVCEANELQTINPEVATSADFAFQYGATIVSFEAELDGRLQEEKLIARGWSYANQEVIEQEVEAGDLSSTGNLDSATLASDLENNEETGYYSGLQKEEEVEAQAKAEQKRRRLSKIRASVVVQGQPDAAPGKTAELSGLGDRFNGNALISGVAHTFKEGTWKTQLQLGLDPQSHLERFKPMPKSTYVIPRSSGLEIGIVKALEDDPDGEFRVQVYIPTMADDTGIWARMAQLDAGDNRGTFFRPEIEDEVIVGFVNNDPRAPVILGCLHSSSKPAPIEPTDNNHEKGIVTRSEMKLHFDDEKKDIVIETPKGNVIKISEDEGGILIEDENSNKMEMTSDGIAIESAADLTIKATGDVTIEGVNVSLEAQAQFKAEGAAGAELSTSGTAVVKGSLVQIN